MLYVYVSVLLGKLDFELVTLSPPLFGMAGQPLWGQGLSVYEADRTRSETQHAPGLLLTSDKPHAEISYFTKRNIHRRQTSTPPCGIRPCNRNT